MVRYCEVLRAVSGKWQALKIMSAKVVAKHRISFRGLCDPAPQTGWLQMTEVSSLTVLKARSLT